MNKQSTVRTRDSSQIQTEMGILRSTRIQNLQWVILLVYLAASLPACLASQNEPIRFDHKRHATLKIECKYCHPAVDQDALARFPTAAKCMTCHRTVKQDSAEIRRLAALPAGRKPFPSQNACTRCLLMSYSVTRGIAKRRLIARAVTVTGARRGDQTSAHQQESLCGLPQSTSRHNRLQRLS